MKRWCVLALAVLAPALPAELRAEPVHISIVLTVRDDGSVLRNESLALKDQDGNTVAPIYCERYAGWREAVCEATAELAPGTFWIEGEVDAYANVDAGSGYTRPVGVYARYAGTVAFGSARKDTPFRGRLMGNSEIVNCALVSCPKIKSFTIKSPPVVRSEPPEPSAVRRGAGGSRRFGGVGNDNTERVHISMELTVPGTDGSVLRNESFALKDQDGNTVEAFVCDSHGSWLRTVCEVSVELPPAIFRIEGEVDAYTNVDAGFGNTRRVGVYATYRGAVAFGSRREDVPFRGRLVGIPEVTNCARDSCPTVASFTIKSPPAVRPEPRELTVAEECDAAGGLVCGNSCAKSCVDGTQAGGVLYEIGAGGPSRGGAGADRDVLVRPPVARRGPGAARRGARGSRRFGGVGDDNTERVHISMALTVPGTDGSVLRNESFALKDQDGNTVEAFVCDSHGSWLRTVCEVSVELPAGVFWIEGEVDAYTNVDVGSGNTRPVGVYARYRGTVAFGSRREDIPFRGRLMGIREVTNCARDSCPKIASFTIKSPPAGRAEPRELTVAEECDAAGGLVCGGYCSKVCIDGTQAGIVLYEIGAEIPSRGRDEVGRPPVGPAGMEFVWVPPGEFVMGSVSPEASGEEQPLTRVRISQGFWLGESEVTQAQWEAVMGEYGYGFSGCRRCPVVNTSWGAVQEFIGRLNAQTGSAMYRLPTEAEWEYAARAGTTRDRYGRIETVANHAGNSSGSTPPRVGRKTPNAFGLYDVLGNVWEWVQDWHGSLPGGSVTDPGGPKTGSHRVGRGGSWLNGPESARASSRAAMPPGARYSHLGFRLLRKAS